MGTVGSYATYTVDVPPGGDAAALRAGDPSNANVRSDGVNWWLMAAEHSVLESPLSSNILLPFCYHFWHTFLRLETKVGESVLKSPSLKWKKNKEFLSFVGFLNLALHNPPSPP